MTISVLPPLSWERRRAILQATTYAEAVTAGIDAGAREAGVYKNVFTNSLNDDTWKNAKKRLNNGGPIGLSVHRRLRSLICHEAETAAHLDKLYIRRQQGTEKAPPLIWKDVIQTLTGIEFSLTNIDPDEAAQLLLALKHLRQGGRQEDDILCYAVLGLAQLLIERAESHSQPNEINWLAVEVLCCAEQLATTFAELGQLIFLIHYMQIKWLDFSKEVLTKSKNDKSLAFDLKRD